MPVPGTLEITGDSQMWWWTKHGLRVLRHGWRVGQGPEQAESAPESEPESAPKSARESESESASADEPGSTTSEPAAAP